MASGLGLKIYYTDTSVSLYILVYCHTLDTVVYYIKKVSIHPYTFKFTSESTHLDYMASYNKIKCSDLREFNLFMKILFYLTHI